MGFRSSHGVWLGGAALAAGLALVPVSAQQVPAERVDYDAIYKIKDEGFQRSKVMEILSWLTDVYGPRLTNSPGFRKAGDWAVKEMTSWGLGNGKLEPFPFGRGWSNDRFSMTATTPGGSFPVIGMATAWTSGTSAPVSADAVFAPVTNEEELAQFKGKLQGKVVFTQALREVPALWTAPSSRYSDGQLAELVRDTDAAPRSGRFAGRAGGRGAAALFSQRLAQFLKEEGAITTVTTGTRGDGGTLFVQGAAAANRQPNADTGLPAVVIAVEHYGRIVRTLQKSMPVRIDLDIRNTFHDSDTASFNVVAEIPGTDKADELVMLGAHFDSWHGATGATDNASGSAVMMEAMRILKQSGLKMRRTVRIGLWGGEEQGLIGSREYVTAHFANVADMILKPAHAKFAGYFNVDNGTGSIRGVYL